MWQRIFASNDVQVQPADLLAYLHRHGQEVAGHFRGDAQGWFSAELVLPGSEVALEVQRYLAGEPGIRDELNTWAAWLETREGNPHAADLMRRVIQSPQVFTIACPPELLDDADAKAAARLACVFLAEATAGVYQIDDEGFFATDGTLLAAEAP